MLDNALLAKIVENPQLPSPPAIALQVCEMASRLDCSLQELSEAIRMDPALCGKLLKTVNSALFSLPRAVTSIQRAINMLGLRPVRSLVLSLSLASLQNPAIPSASLRAYWTSSVAGAIIARELAVKLCRSDPDDDMVAGLLRDLGVLVLAQIYPDKYGQAPEDLATNQCWLEENLLGFTHADVSAALLRRWGLPEDIASAVRFHHQPDLAIEAGPAVTDRARLLHFANLVAQLQCTPDQPKIARAIVNLAREQFGMNEQELGDFLEPLTAKVKAFASLLNVEIGRCDNFTVVLSRSIEELVALTVQNSVDRNRAEEEKKEAEQEAQQWRRTAQRLRRESIRDPLTGIYSRGFFEEALALEFKRAARRSTVLGLLFIDLDGFKECNDGHGHLFGDQVLKEVASKLRREVRGGEVVARYGGDEFCIIALDTSPAGLQALANRLWDALNPLHVRRGTEVVQVGASIGGALSLPRRPEQTQEGLLASADKAMYEAKAAEHKHIPIVSLLSEADTLLIAEVHKRLFSTFLVGRSSISEGQVQRALRKDNMPAYAIGRVARQLGWITPRKVRSVLSIQRQTRQVFGEIAVAQKYITQDQLYWLLALQRERPEAVADTLFDSGTVAEQEIPKIVKEYYQTMPRANKLGNASLASGTRSR